MGSNMQRQAVPLISPKSPIVGTGIESQVAVDSRSCIVSPIDGTVVYVDSEKIHIKRKDVQNTLILYEGEDIFEIKLKKISQD